MSTCCRLCLATQGQFILIFSEDPLHPTRSCAGLIFFTTGIKVLSNDDLPRHVCDKCLELMYGYCHFKKQCAENNRILQESSKKQKPKENLLVQAKRRYTSLFRNRPPTSRQLPLESVKPLTQKPLPTGIKPITVTNKRILIESIVSLQPHQAEDVPKQSMESFLENYQPVPDMCQDPLDLNAEINEDSKSNLLIDIKNVSVVPTPTDPPQPEPQPFIPEQLPPHQPELLIVKSEVFEEIPTFSLPNDVDVSNFLEITMDGVETTISIDDSLSLVTVESEQILIPPITKSSPMNPPKHSFESFNYNVSPSKVLANNIVRKYNSIVSKPMETSLAQLPEEVETVGKTEDHSKEDNNCFLTKFEEQWLKRRKQMQENELKINKARNEKKGNKYSSRPKMKVNNVPFEVLPVIIPSDEHSEPVIESMEDISCNENGNKCLPAPNIMKVPTGGIVKGVGLLSRNPPIVIANKTATNPTFVTANKTVTNPTPVTTNKAATNPTPVCANKTRTNSRPVRANKATTNPTHVRANRTRTNPTPQKCSTAGNLTTDDCNAPSLETDGCNGSVRRKPYDLEKNLKPSKQKPCTATTNPTHVRANRTRTNPTPQKCSTAGNLTTEDCNVPSLETDGCNGPVRRKPYDLEKNLLKPFKQKPCTAKKMYRCAECDFTCTEYSPLVEHIHVHNSVRQFRCQIRVCGRLFSSQDLLDNHYYFDDHTPEVLCYKCGIITKNFSRHMSWHRMKEEGKKIDCHDCNKKFYTKSLLCNHIRDKHLPVNAKKKQVFTCTLCNATLISQKGLEKHDKRVHKPQLNEVVCLLCSKAFYQKQQLVRHMRSHTGEAPFNCKYNCGKSFSMTWNRIQHERLHTGEKPYKCVAPGCEEAFRHNVTRKIHHRKHHKDVPLLEPKPSKFHRPKKIREKE